MIKPVGIIGAMGVEIEAVKSMGETVSEESRGGLAFTSINLNGIPCVVSQCGVGKVNAAICAQEMIDLYSPRLLINIGVAGGTAPKVEIGDLVVASHCVQYDFVPLDYERAVLELPGIGLVDKFPCDEDASGKILRAAKNLYGGTHYGPIATGDRFVAQREVGKGLYETYGALACEMEGGAIAHAALASGVPCAVIRAISDGARESSTVDFYTFVTDTAKKAQELLASVIGKL